ncbi:VanZ family protein [Bacillus sp. Marseille-P3661]|uniref:VanZ family protein n=1 Tax=Bacillus sp. Marseille-P3661 TaxID=1936234 RepID=UPI000C8637EF|nr:VanZ family protein [Bacillus sp. Marseille-P3661]
MKYFTIVLVVLYSTKDNHVIVLIGDTMKRKKLWWMLVIIWCGLIFTITESPRFTGENTKKAIVTTVHKTTYSTKLDSPSVINKINKIMRKSGHFLGFGVLALLLWRALSPNRYSLLLAWLFATVYAMTDEYHQAFVIDRTSSIKDVMIDSAGAAVFLIVFYGISKIIVYRQKAMKI